MKMVPSSLYDKRYYLSDCSGYREYKKSFGHELESRIERIVKEIPVKEGVKILDIGCGRGEVCFWAAKQGTLVWGIDYSKSAIELANKARLKSKKNVQDKTSFGLMNGKQLKYKDGSFDAVLLIEVLEHLYPLEQEAVLKEAKRVIKNNGFIFIHTEPNKLFYDLAWKFWCYPMSTLLVGINRFITSKTYPNIPRPSEVRSKEAKRLHINEATYVDLKRLFKKLNLTGQIKTTNIVWIKPIFSWKDVVYNLLVYFDPFSRIFPLNIVFGQDFLAVLRKR